MSDQTCDALCAARQGTPMYYRKPDAWQTLFSECSNCGRAKLRVELCESEFCVYVCRPCRKAIGRRCVECLYGQYVPIARSGRTLSGREIPATMVLLECDSCDSTLFGFKDLEALTPGVGDDCKSNGI